MKIHVFPLGVLRTNCYLVEGQTSAAVIDPGGDPHELVCCLNELGVPLTSIILTHGHADHIAGAMELKRQTGAKIYMHPQDAPMLNATQDAMACYLGLKEEVILDQEFEQMTLPLGDTEFQVLHTPGHTPGCCCLYNSAVKVLFSGDTLFAGSIGRSDLAGGNAGQLAESLGMLKLLPEDVVVYPGHGPHTTIGEEKVRNRFW